MRRSVRKSLAWTTLALFGVQASLGYGLHFFSAEGHHHSCLETACCDHGSGPSEDPAEHGDQHRGEPGVGLADSFADHDSHACPICQFFAQAQYSALPSALTVALEPVFAPPFETSATRIAAVPSPYHARGPPRG